MSDYSTTADFDAVSMPCSSPEKRNLVLVPRKLANIFGADNRVKDILESYPEKGGDSPLKKLEYNFYPDLNSERTITAILTEEAWDPHRDTLPTTKEGTISFELIKGSAEDFELSTPGASMADGYVEFTIKALKLYKEDQIDAHQNVKIRATADKQTAELSLTVHRNEDVEYDFSSVLNRETILVKQGKAWVCSEGVKRLQKLLNQVVARHKAANEFQWLKVDGEYGSKVSKDVKAFLDHFKGEFDYEKGHFDAKIDDALKKYIKDEYGSHQDGNVVDHDLLVGEKEWAEGESYTTVDGLLDIYNGVVRCFFGQMDDMAEAYSTDFNTFWLHRPSDKPYNVGDETDDRFLVKPKALRIRKTPGKKSTKKKEDDDKLELVGRGTTLEYEKEKKTVGGSIWYKVKTPSGKKGWCHSGFVMKVRDDKTKSEKNFGNYGVNGVAYTLGAKDRPDDFATGLLNNTPGPADILCWEQYVPLQPDKLPGRLGEMKDALEQPGTGVDCSGFITNCITEAKFGDGKRIIPETVTNIKRLEPRLDNLAEFPDKWPYDPEGEILTAKGFRNKHTGRKIPKHNEPKKQWLDKTDLIITSAHIAWVADESPDISQKEFMVFNAHGKDEWYVEPHDDKFIMKVIKMKFKCWGINLSTNKMFRLYFWE